MKLQNHDFIKVQKPAKQEPFFEVLRDFFVMVLVVAVFMFFIYLAKGVM